jgi:hypothetical protein
MAGQSGAAFHQDHQPRLELEHNPFDFVERDFVIPPIIKLGRPRAFLRGHLLRVFEQPAFRQVDRDAGFSLGLSGSASPLRHAWLSLQPRHIRSPFHALSNAIRQRRHKRIL